jgi:L-amino acid N-acyltransferase YncA
VTTTAPTIREYRDGDDAAIHAAYEEAIAAGESFPPDEPPTLDRTRAVWIDDKSAVLVAELDGEFAGCCYVRPNFSGRAGRIANAGYLVAESARGRGVGRALLERSLNEARRLGFRAMMFNLVFERNPARRLWEAAGFEVIGRIPNAIDDDQDALIYFREL